jgi:hypothetical protein
MAEIPGSRVFPAAQRGIPVQKAYFGEAGAAGKASRSGHVSATLP